MKAALFLLLAVVSTLFVGCSSQPTTVVATDPVDRQLLQAAREIVRIRQKSAAIESATHFHDNRTRHFSYNKESLPVNWQEEVVLVEDFYGDIESFVRLVSRMSGMNDPRIYGSRPPNPVPIAIYAGKRSVIDFLADAGHQAGDDIRVMPSVPINAVIIQYGITGEGGVEGFYDGK